MKKTRNPKPAKKSDSKQSRESERELLLTRERVAQLNQELEETNAGVIALYGELEDKAKQLQRANEMKSRFLSAVSHEIRTPINSILSLSRILLDRLDGDLTAEQEKQVQFIRKAGQDLSELVNGLLDIAKIEAGKIEVKTSEFSVPKLFGTLEGLMGPLNSNPAVALIFEESKGIPLLKTDEYKLNQILRNLIGNAMKFTDRGEIRVSARMADERDAVIFSVADTGIGIAVEDQERIFEEFTQLEGPLQRRFKGTGLGLPLSKRLTELLGGSISLESKPGAGSTFAVTIPVIFPGGKSGAAPPVSVRQPEPAHFILTIETSPDALLRYNEYLKDSGIGVVHVAAITEAQEVLERLRPILIMLHIGQPKEGYWDFISKAKAEAKMKNIPILVVSGAADREKAVSLGADGFCVKPVKRTSLLSHLKKLAPAEKILIIDDEENARYVFRKLLASTPYIVIEAHNGPEGLRRSGEDKPNLIFLDILMPEMNGFETLERLKADPTTREIPVIILTGTELTDEDRKQLGWRSVDILTKKNLSSESLIAHIRKGLARR